MLARSPGIGYAHGRSWFLKWNGSFQGEDCRWSHHHDEEEVKSIYTHVAIVDPECLRFSLELGLATDQQLNISPKNWDMRCSEAPCPRWPPDSILSDCFSNIYSILFSRQVWTLFSTWVTYRLPLCGGDWNSKLIF